MPKHPTRKDKRKGPQIAGHLNPQAATNVRKAVKRESAKRNRLRPIDDETPYKRLSDPWNYD